MHGGRKIFRFPFPKLHSCDSSQAFGHRNINRLVEQSVSGSVLSYERGESRCHTNPRETEDLCITLVHANQRNELDDGGRISWA